MSSNEEIRRWAEVPADLAAGRFDQVAAALFPEFSRSRLQRWIESGELRLDGQRGRSRDRVAPGQSLSLEATTPVAPDWSAAQPVPFDVVHEDDAVLVVNKPAGVVVHPGAGHPDGTLVNGLLERFPMQRMLPRAGIVHRLDVGTTGLMVVARSLAAHGELVGALSRREIRRVYQAIVEGVVTGPHRIDRPLGRDPRNRLRVAVRDDGRPAVTHVRLLERLERHTHVQAQLETGRTHQIRVHLGSIHHPLVGDPLYGARGILPRDASAEQREYLRTFPRPALHAWRLAFEHPLEGHEIVCEAPLPQDFEQLLAALGAGGAAGTGANA